MNVNNQENNKILFGRLEGSRITKRGFWACFSEKSKKRWNLLVNWKQRPNNNRGMTYQTDETKHLTIFPEYLFAVVKLACYYINIRLLWRVFTNNLLKY